MSVVRIWARKVVQHKHRDGSLYDVHVQANEIPRSIVTRGNAAAFILKRKLNV